MSILAAVWGLQLYGEWLILSAVPAYIAVTDIGLFTAASNDMIMRVARDDREGALVTFQASTAAVTVLFALVGVVLFALAAAAPLASWLNLEIISESTAAWVLVILGLNTMLVAYAGVLYGVLASEGLYGEGVFALAGITLIEFCGLAAVVLLGGDPALAASAMFATRLPGTIAMFLYARRKVPWLLLGRPAGVGRALKPLITPSLASGAFPAGFALNIQGMVIMVGVVLGPASTAVFSTFRTMSRLTVQVLASVPAVIAPEISKAFAEEDIDRLRSLHRRGCQAVVRIAAPIVAILALFGQSIVSSMDLRHRGDAGRALVSVPRGCRPVRALVDQSCRDVRQEPPPEPRDLLRCLLRTRAAGGISIAPGVGPRRGGGISGSAGGGDGRGHAPPNHPRRRRHAGRVARAGHEAAPAEGGLRRPTGAGGQIVSLRKGAAGVFARPSA